MPRQCSQLKRFKLWAARLSALLALGLVFACGKGSGTTPSASPSRPPGAPPEATEPLPARAVALARADVLAIQASRPGTVDAAGALAGAATIRTRLFRREHREADALEALELLRQQGRASNGARCSAELQRALLEGEQTGDADATYRALYGLSRGADAGCAARLESALAMLAAFRPSDSALAALEPHALPEASSSAAPPPPSAQAPNGAVTTATLTHIERYSAKDAARVVVFVSNPVRFEVGTVEGTAGAGPRLFVDLRGAH
ncbi:MAG TPA: hypothetical protein VNG33_09945, partial [Polyangiaceae bacterium]|nr:hypothetical protein [Polyangiaceae bacterium]